MAGVIKFPRRRYQGYGDGGANTMGHRSPKVNRDLILGSATQITHRIG
jgi:hypothetical protein